MNDRVGDWHASGVVELTGRPDGAGLLPPGSAATVARQLSTYLRRATACSAHVVDVDGRALLSERARFTGWTRQGTRSVGGHTRLLPASDGWVVVACARPDDPSLLGALIGHDITEADPWPLVEDWILAHTASEFDSRAALLGVAGGVVATPKPAPSVVPDLSTAHRSVEGALVVDFSALWAGPLCSHLLGLAGARILKIETPQRPDGARLGNADFYRLLHGGHESVVLDPSESDDRAALVELVRRADIVVEASRPRALQRFGLDAATFVGAGAVWVSITARGRASDRIGFGDDIAATSGLTARDDDGTPLFVGDAIADPLSGLAAAAAVLSTAPGDGRLVEISMTDVVSSTLSDEIDSNTHDSVGEVDFVRSAHASAQRRVTSGDAPASGDDTDAVLSEFGLLPTEQRPSYPDGAGQ